MSRNTIECFFMPPHRPNIYQSVKFVKKIQSRWDKPNMWKKKMVQQKVGCQNLNFLYQSRSFARDLSFLLTLAAAGKKIQIFCGTQELMNNTGPCLLYFSTSVLYCPALFFHFLHISRLSSTFLSCCPSLLFSSVLIRSYRKETSTIVRIAKTQSVVCL